jgi:hypothetical protein
LPKQALGAGVARMREKRLQVARIIHIESDARKL